MIIPRTNDVQIWAIKVVKKEIKQNLQLLLENMIFVTLAKININNKTIKFVSTIMAHPSQNFPSLGQHTSSTGLPLHHPMQIGGPSPTQDFR